MQEYKRQGYLGTRAARLERHRCLRKHAIHQPWCRLTRNHQEVAKGLTRGQVTLVTISGWGFVASFLAFLNSEQPCSCSPSPLDLQCWRYASYHDLDS
jgi:hypothetical protein